MSRRFGDAKGFGTKFENSEHRSMTGGQNGPRSMSRTDSKRHFAKHASMTHKYNMPQRVPMRGGIRL